MPTYDYRCQACDHQFEQFQSITAPPVKKCPSCRKSRVRRLPGTGAALLFKGSGFYITDYRDKAYTDKAKAESGASAGQAKPADTKPADTKPTDTKPAGTKPADTPAQSESKPKPASKAAAKPRSRK